MIEIVNNDTVRITVTNPPSINVTVSTASSTIPVVIGIQGPPGPPGSGSTVQEVTYAQLKNLVDSAQLVPLQWYKITDYRTAYTMPHTDYFYEAPIEPLLVQAISNDKLSSMAYSTVYPQDIIGYELVCTHYWNQRLIDADRGFIYYREDTSRNHKDNHDFRGCKWRRWNEQPDGSGAWIVINDNGNPYQDFPTYVWYNGDTTNPAPVNGNDFSKGYSEVGNVGSYNNVFFGSVSGNTSEGDFSNNTFYDPDWVQTFTQSVRFNRFGARFADNVFMSSCAYNDFRDNYTGNIHTSFVEGNKTEFDISSVNVNIMTNCYIENTNTSKFLQLMRSGNDVSGVAILSKDYSWLRDAIHNDYRVLELDVPVSNDGKRHVYVSQEEQYILYHVNSTEPIVLPYNAPNGFTIKFVDVGDNGMTFEVENNAYLRYMNGQVTPSFSTPDVVPYEYYTFYYASGWVLVDALDKNYCYKSLTDFISTIKVAGEALLAHRVVMIADDGKVYYADRTVLSHIHRVLGITTHAVGEGGWVTIHTYGMIEEPSWNLTVGNQVYLDTNGYMTQTVPTSGFLLKIGFPLSATSLFVDIDTPIVLA